MKKVYVKLPLIILFLFLLFIIGWLWWKNCLLRDDVYAMSVYAGTIQALTDYDNDKLRLYELKSESAHAFSGETKEGFEIWYWPYYGRDIYSSEIFVSSYNKKMKKLTKMEPESATINDEKIEK